MLPKQSEVVTCKALNFSLSGSQHSLQDKITPEFNKDVFSAHLSCVILRNSQVKNNFKFSVKLP